MSRGHQRLRGQYREGDVQIEAGTRRELQTPQRQVKSDRILNSKSFTLSWQPVFEHKLLIFANIYSADLNYSDKMDEIGQCLFLKLG